MNSSLMVGNSDILATIEAELANVSQTQIKMGAPLGP